MALSALLISNSPFLVALIKGSVAHRVRCLTLLPLPLLLQLSLYQFWFDIGGLSFSLSSFIGDTSLLWLYSLSSRFLCLPRPNDRPTVYTMYAFSGPLSVCVHCVSVWYIAAQCWISAARARAPSCGRMWWHCCTDTTGLHIARHNNALSLLNNNRTDWVHA